MGKFFYYVYRYICPASLFVVLATACSGSLNPEVERAPSYTYQTGHPEVMLASEGYWDENGNTFIQLAAHIVYASLLFEKEGDKRKADLAIELIITKKNDEDKVLYSNRFSYDKTVDDYRIAQSQDSFRYMKTFATSPGTYHIDFTLIDQSARKKTRIERQVELVNPSKEITTVTPIQLRGKENGLWFPVTTYNIPSRYDSLEFTYQVNNNSETPLTIETELFRIVADSTPAIAMFKNNYTPSDLKFKGIDYSEKSTIQTGRRVLMQKGIVTIKFKISLPDWGNYRFNVLTSDEDGFKKLNARDFGIKNLSYPTLKTPQELAAPLVYLMGQGDYEEFIGNKSGTELKRAIDRFWLSHIKNPNDANDVIQLFYERVEEANKYFSNFKEGWKTERGRIYVLFGPPLNVTELLNKEYWSYSHDRSDSNLNFTFNRFKLKSDFYPFEHFILNRSTSLYQAEYRQTQLWLTGHILKLKT